MFLPSISRVELVVVQAWDRAGTRAFAQRFDNPIAQVAFLPKQQVEREKRPTLGIRNRLLWGHSR
jgi:hypothetical protein